MKSRESSRFILFARNKGKNTLNGQRSKLKILTLIQLWITGAQLSSWLLHGRDDRKMNGAYTSKRREIYALVMTAHDREKSNQRAFND